VTQATKAAAVTPAVVDAEPKVPRCRPAAIQTVEHAMAVLGQAVEAGWHHGTTTQDLDGWVKRLDYVREAFDAERRLRERGASGGPS